MKSRLRLLWVVAFILLLGGDSYAKEWRGIVPLHSTREDVIRLLGVSPDINDIRAKYFFDKEDVYIVFSGDQLCALHSKHTVLLIQVAPKTQLSLSELKLDERGFRKFEPSSPPDIGYDGFISDVDGVLIRTFKGKVVEIVYVANAADRNRCPAYYGDLEGFLHLYVDSSFSSAKFDEFGDIGFADEKARLDTFADQLQAHPETLGHIIVYAGRRSQLGAAAARAKRARTYLVTQRRIDGRRIATTDGGQREERSVY